MNESESASIEKRVQEKLDNFNEKYLVPIQAIRQSLEEFLMKLEEYPTSVEIDPHLPRMISIEKDIREFKNKLGEWMRMLLLAHASGAAIVVNMLPTLLEKPKALPIATAALWKFAFGLFALLGAFTCQYITALVGILANIAKIINLTWTKSLSKNVDFGLGILGILFAAASMLSFCLAIYGAARSLSLFG